MGLKLDIGAGKKPTRGYKTLDIEEYAHPDYLGDFRDMTFSDVEEIRSNFLFEHFDRKEAIEVLKQWKSWLRVGGKLLIEVPDMEEICKVFGINGVWANRDILISHIYGSQERDWAYHKDGWYEDKMRRVLTETGFEIELIKHKHSYIRVEGIRYRLPNLLAIAIKL
jgi:predicted SAM-dependent methyltransferase